MKFRIKFAKTGSMKFIGHLDVMRYFQKVMRRNNIDVKLSEGFSPHQIMSFASPLGIGLTTLGDYLDVEINNNIFQENTGEYVSDDLCQKIMDRMNENSIDEIYVKSVTRVDDLAKTSMSILAACDYDVFFKEERVGNMSSDAYKNAENKTLAEHVFAGKLPSMIDEFLNQPEINVLKKTKKSEKTVNIKDNIYKMEVLQSPESAEINACNTYLFSLELTSGSVLNIKPEIVIKAFLEYFKMNYDALDYQITRTEMYADRGAAKGEVRTLASEVKPELYALSEN